MKRLNFKFLIFLLIPSIALAIGLHLRHSDQVVQTEEMWLASAEKAVEDGRLHDAVKQLQKFLRRHPDDLPRQRQVAHIAADVFINAKIKTKEDYLAAKNTLEKAARTSLDDPIEKRALESELIDVFATARKFDEAHGYIVEHLKDAPDDLKLNMLAAECVVDLQIDTEQESAEHYLSTIVGFLPKAKKAPYFDDDAALDIHHIEAYWMLARFYQHIRNDKVRGLRVIERMFSVNKDLKENPEEKALAAAAWLYRGKYRRDYEVKVGTRSKVAKQLELARSEIKRAVELDGTNEQALLATAQVAMEEGKYEAVKKTLSEAKRYHPESVAIYQRLSLLGQKMGDLEAAVKATDQGLAYHPNNTDLLWLRCNYQLGLSDYSGMRDTLARMKEHDVNRSVQQVVNALMPICQEKWGLAAQRLRNVRPQAANNAQLREAVDLNLARCYGETQEIDRQLQVYERMATDPLYGDRDAVLLGRTRSLVFKKRYKEAHLALLARRSTGKVMSPALTVLLQQTAQATGSLLADVPSATPGAENLDSSAVDELLAGSFDDWFKDPEFWRKVGTKTDRLLSSSDKEKQAEAVVFYREALDFYDAHVDEMPEDERRIALQVWRNNYYQYIGYVLNENGREAAIGALQSLKDARGDTPRLIIEASRIIARGEGPGKKLRGRLKELESRITALPVEDQSTVWVQIGSAYARTGDAGKEESKRCWARAAEVSPQNKAAMQQLFLLAWQAGDEPAMQQIMVQIKKQFSERDPLWKYANALYLVTDEGKGSATRTDEQKRSRLRKARRLVNEALQVRQNWELLFHLRGKINEALGDSDAAIRDFDEARRLGVRDTRMISHLITMRLRRREYAKAKAVLREAGPTFPGRERFWAIIQAASGSNAQTIVDAIEDVPLDEEAGWYAHVELAEMYRRAALLFNDKPSVRKLHDMAEAAYRDAIEFEPDVPDTWMVLIDFLVGTKHDNEAAEETLRRAELRMADDQTRLLMAEAYIQLEDADQAERYLLAELNSHPDNLAAIHGLAGHYLRADDTPQAGEQLERMISYDGEENEKTLQHIMWAHRQVARILFETRRHDDFHEALAHVDWNLQAKPDSVEDQILHARLLAMRSEPRYQREAMKVLDGLRQANVSSLDFDSMLLLASLHYRDASSTPDESWRKCREVMDLVRASEGKEGERWSRQQRAQWLAQYAIMLMDRKDFPQAGKHVAALRRLEPVEPRTIRLVAKWSIVNQIEEAAEKAIDQIIPTTKVNDETAPQLLMAAKLFDEQGINHRADDMFRRLNREHPSGKYELAKYLARSGSTSEAMFIADELSQAGNLKDACQVGLLSIWELGDESTQQHHKQIREWFTQARKNSGEGGFSVQMLAADFAVAVGDSSGAIRILRELLNSRNLSYHQEGQVANNLAYVLAGRGEKLDEALELVGRALNLVGPTSGILDTKGVVHLARKECEEAMESLEEATAMDANRQRVAGSMQGNAEAFAQTYFHLALAYQCSGKKSEAANAFNTAQDRGFRTDDMKPLPRRWHSDLVEYLGP